MNAPHASSAEQQIYQSFSQACFFGNGPTIVRGLPGTDPVQEFAHSTASGLAANPRHLDCRFLYDSEGSALFDRITHQPEYYLTRIESSILADNAAHIRQLSGRVNLVELGSGNSSKTSHLLRAWLEIDKSAWYVPVDVSENALVGACNQIAAEYQGVRVTGLNCDFQQAFPLFSQLSPSLVMLLGSTVGNFAPSDMSRFFSDLSTAIHPGNFFLIGIDLVKEPPVLEAAYNDAAGVTANFTRNIFVRMNRELGCAIDTEAIEHVARYNTVKDQIEIFARFTHRQTFFLKPLGQRITVQSGDMVQVEISRKFRLEHFIPYIEEFGFVTEKIFTDERNWFALLLLRRKPNSSSAVRRKG